MAASVVPLTHRTVDVLALLGPTAYREAFTQLWVPQELQAWLKTQYGREVLLAQLYDANIHWRIMYEDQTPVGFAKLVLHKQPVIAAFEDVAELEKIYLLEANIGKGYAHLLFQSLLEICSRYRIRNLWLDVLDTNLHAQSVYAHWGFQPIGLNTLNFGHFTRTMIVMHKQLL